MVLLLVPRAQHRAGHRGVRVCGWFCSLRNSAGSPRMCLTLGFPAPSRDHHPTHTRGQHPGLKSLGGSILRRVSRLVGRSRPRPLSPSGFSSEGEEPTPLGHACPRAVDPLERVSFRYQDTMQHVPPALRRGPSRRSPCMSPPGRRGSRSMKSPFVTSHPSQFSSCRPMSPRGISQKPCPHLGG